MTLRTPAGGERAVKSAEVMSEPVQSSQPGPPGPPSVSVPPTSMAQPSGPPPPAGAGRAEDPEAAEESVRRKLLMGAALLLAMASIYAGVFNVGRLAQIVLAAGATMAVVLALTSSNRRRNS